MSLQREEGRRELHMEGFYGPGLELTHTHIIALHILLVKYKLHGN